MPPFHEKISRLFIAPHIAAPEQNQRSLEKPSMAALPPPVQSGDILWNPVRAASLATRDFSEFDATSFTHRVLRVVRAPAPLPSGETLCGRAMTIGKGQQFARAHWNVRWRIPKFWRTSVMFYLPEGFYAAMTAAVQLVGWDCWPVANNQMRLIIWHNDKRARLFLKSNGRDHNLTNAFTIPEAQWVNIVIEQRIAKRNAWSHVFQNDELVASGERVTATDYAVKRMRYGLVATGNAAQTNPLTVYFAQPTLYEGN